MVEVVVRVVAVVSGGGGVGWLVAVVCPRELADGNHTHNRVFDKAGNEGLRPRWLSTDDSDNTCSGEGRKIQARRGGCKGRQPAISSRKAKVRASQRVTDRVTT